MATNSEQRVRFAIVASLVSVFGAVAIAWCQARVTFTLDEFFRGAYAYFWWLGGTGLRQWHLRESGLGFPKYYISPEFIFMGVASAFGIYAFLTYFLHDHGGLYYSACVPLGVFIGLRSHVDTWLTDLPK
jgi:hypothetical protein